MDIPKSFTELLAWLTGAGGAFLLIAWAAAWGLEGWSTWDRFTSKAKSAIILALSMALALLAAWVQSWSAETLSAIEPFARAVMVTVGMWLATQTAHRLDNLRQ